MFTRKKKTIFKYCENLFVYSIMLDYILKSVHLFGTSTKQLHQYTLLERNNSFRTNLK